MTLDQPETVEAGQTLGLGSKALGLGLRPPVHGLSASVRKPWTKMTVLGAMLRPGGYILKHLTAATSCIERRRLVGLRIPRPENDKS